MKKTIQFIRRLSTGGAETLVKDYVLLSDNQSAVTYYYIPEETANEKQLRENNKEFCCLSN